MVGDEVFVEDPSLFVQQIHAGEGDTIPVMIFGDVGIADTECVDDDTADVGQQVVLDAEVLGETGQQVRWIRADGVDLDAFAKEGGMLALQLDQLRLAEASPGGGAIEQDQRSCLWRAVGEARELPARVGELEIGDDLADVRPIGKSSASGSPALMSSAIAH